jgi:predicted ATP-grasp superfamily ATP-dependent carboligase
MQIDKKMPGAIVLGGNFVGLGVVRSLGQRGIQVWVIDSDRNKSIAQFSRYTKRFIEQTGAIPELLLREAQAHDLQGWVLFPVTDEYVEILSENRELLGSSYRVTTGPPEITKFALDKRWTYARADELEIPTPWTLMSKSLADFDAQDLPYPVILKPAVNHHFFPQTNVKAFSVSTPVHLRNRYLQMNEYIPADEILIQEHIPGAGESQFSYCAACREGKVYASLVARRTRQYPVEFGNASSFVETAEQPVVAAAGQKFLESIGFDGIGEVEFKFDSRDGQYKILDFNPRTWGWHTLGQTVGIDFTYLLWRQSLGLEILPPGAPRKAAWLREITDLMAIANSISRVREIKNLLDAIWRRKFKLATFSLSDPAPFFAEFFMLLSSGLTRQKQAEDFLELNSNALRPEAVSARASELESQVQ